MPNVKARKRRGGIFCLILLCILSFSLMWRASLQEPAIMDELAHIPAGYGYVKYFDFRLNPEHPPLLKAIAAAPLLGLNLNFPTDRDPWAKDLNGQWDAGRQFLYDSGNSADKIVQTSRYGPMLLTILLIIVIYFWSRRLLGPGWAFLPTTLFALSPNVLAHGHYVTTDIAAAFAVVVATYFFLKFLREPDTKNIVFSGVAFGVAQLCKFSAVMLIPFFVVMLGVWILVQWRARKPRLSVWSWYFVKYKSVFIGKFLLSMIIGAVVIYAVYFVFTRNYPMERQARETEILLSSFAHGPTPEGKICIPMRCLAELNIWMTGNEITRPAAEYMLGVLMVTQRAAGGNNNYFLGEVDKLGKHYYFPVVYMLKEPLPVLILVFLALFLAVKRAGATVMERGLKRSFEQYLRNHFTYFAMFVFVAFYWAYSIKSPLNIGVRHLFPTLPFIYILMTRSLKNWVAGLDLGRKRGLGFMLQLIREMARAGMKYVGIFVLCAWFVIEAVVSYPYYLSYFNQLGGGTWGGYKYAVDSNYDWGQDMLRLKEFMEEHPEINKIAVDYFGGGEPRYYLGDKFEGWWSAKGNPKEHGIEWLAVSVNTLQGAIQPTAPFFERKWEDEYRWLTLTRPPLPGRGEVPMPTYRVGTSIFIYKL